MALTRKEKEGLVTSYQNNLQGAKNIVVLKQFGIPVNEVNQVRKSLDEVGGKIQIVKKRIFLNTIKQNGFEGGELDSLEGSVVVLYSYQEEFAPLKVIAKYVKQWKKSESKFAFEYLGGWYDNSWKDAAYVAELANLPSKEELISKFMFLLNYPVSGFVRVLDQIRQKKEQEG